MQSVMDSGLVFPRIATVRVASYRDQPSHHSHQLQSAQGLQARVGLVSREREDRHDARGSGTQANPSWITQTIGLLCKLPGSQQNSPLDTGIGGASTEALPVIQKRYNKRIQERLRRQAEFDARHGKQRSSAPFQPRPLPSGRFGRGTLK